MISIGKPVTSQQALYGDQNYQWFGEEPTERTILITQYDASESTSTTSESTTTTPCLHKLWSLCHCSIHELWLRGLVVVIIFSVVFMVMLVVSSLLFDGNSDFPIIAVTPPFITLTPHFLVFD